MRTTFSAPPEIDINDYQGFVYMITNLVNNRKYIGLKNVSKVKKYPPLKR